MAEDVRALFRDYVARFERGQHPDPGEYRARCEGAWPELADMIDRYLIHAPPPPPAPAHVEAMRLLTSGTPPLIGMRTRRGVPRRDVVRRLLGRFRFPESLRDAVALRYHQFESGLLPLGGIDEGVFEEVAGALGIARDEVLPWSAPRVEAPVFARSARAALASRPGTAVPGEPMPAHAGRARDEGVEEVDRVFGIRRR